ASVSDTEEYEWFVFNSGDDPETDVSVATGTISNEMVTVTDLNPSTEYQFYILSNCGDGDISMMSLPVSFYTLCDGTPGAGTPTSVSSSVCPESQFTIHLDETVSAGPGIAYQWQSSPEGEENWTDLEGETGESVALTQADGMDYRYYV